MLAVELRRDRSGFLQTRLTENIDLPSNFAYRLAQSILKFAISTNSNLSLTPRLCCFETAPQLGWLKAPQTPIMGRRLL